MKNQCPYPVVKISQNPVPDMWLRKLEKECDELMEITWNAGSKLGLCNKIATILID